MFFYANVNRYRDRFEFVFFLQNCQLKYSNLLKTSPETGIDTSIRSVSLQMHRYIFIIYCK